MKRWSSWPGKLDRWLAGRRWTHLSKSFGSRRNCPKYLADGLEVGDIPFLGAACDLVEPADRVRLQTRFGWISRGINDLDLNLDGISTPTHPALPLLPPLLHLPYSTR
jgi:hypothetical protein